MAEVRRSGPPAAVRQWAWALLGVAGVLAIAAGRGGPPHAQPAAAPASQRIAAPAARRRVLAVRSRQLDANRVLVWGSASSPAAASIGLRVHVGGARIRHPRRVPLGDDGLFEVVVKIPDRLEGRPVEVKAYMTRG